MGEILEKLGKRKAADIRTLKRLLRNGIVNFSYVKKSTGKRRDAVGTLNKNLIPKDDRDPDMMDGGSGDIVNYYDIEKKGWRRFDKENFIEYKKDNID